MNKKWFITGLLLTLVMLTFWIYITSNAEKLIPKEILESRTSVYLGFFFIFPLFAGILIMICAFINNHIKIKNVAAR